MTQARSPFEEQGANLSPDGRWVASVSKSYFELVVAVESRRHNKHKHPVARGIRLGEPLSTQIAVSRHP